MADSRRLAAELFRDEQREGVGNNSELDGEAAGGLAIHLSIDSLSVQGFAAERCGLPKMNAAHFAQAPEPQGREISQVARGAARGEDSQLELILE